MCPIIQVPPDPELGPRSQMSQSSDSKPESSHLRPATSADLSHISRLQGDGVSPSYQSPMTSPKSLVSHKSDLSLQNGPPSFLSTPPPTVPAASTVHPRPDAKLEHAGHRSIDTVQLLTVDTDDVCFVFVFFQALSSTLIKIRPFSFRNILSCGRACWH